MVPEIEKTNNIEMVPMEHYQEQYQNADPQEMSVRSQTSYDAEQKAFGITYLGRTYQITWPSFEITVMDDKDVYSPLLDTNKSKILVMRYLTEGISTVSSGKFLTYREVPWGEVYFRQFNGRCMMRLAFSYGNKLDEFRRVCEILGARKLKQGDAGYEFEVFPGYFVQFLLWEGDDEFPPSSQILFSDNFPAGFHAEDLVVVAEVIIGTLKKL